MHDILVLFEIVAALALTAAPPILLVRMLAGGQGEALASLFSMPADPPWPRGVQEEEPLRWRVELIDTQRRTADTPVAVCPSDPRPHRAGVWSDA